MQNNVVLPLAILCFSLLVIINLWNTKAVIKEKGGQLQASQRSQQGEKARVKRAGDEGKRLREAIRRVETKTESARQAAKLSGETNRLHQADLTKLEKVVREKREVLAKLEMEQERLAKSLHAKD